MELSYYLSLPYTIELRRDGDGDWVARIKELRGCTADGATEAEALEELRRAQTEWLTAALEDGVPIPVPEPEERVASGKWLQRVPRALHRDLTILAEAEGVSLTQLVVMILSRYVGGSQAQEHREAWDVWERLTTETRNIWRGSLEMGSSHAYGVLRSICRRLPTHTSLDLRSMEERPFDAHAGKR